MKRIASFFLISAVFGVLFATPVQDPIAVGKGMYKLKFENDRVRVLEVTLLPGQKIDMHSHPDYVACVVMGGKVRFMQEGKKPVFRVLKAGDAMWATAETHAARNVGKTMVKVIVVEMK